MATNDLAAPQDTGAVSPEQDPKAQPALQAKVSGPVYREVSQAGDTEGFASLAECVRSVMKVWARSPEVREEVRQRMHLAVLDPAS